MLGLAGFMERLARPERPVRHDCGAAVEWNDKLTWAPRLCIKAATWTPRSLFDVEPVVGASVRGARPEQMAVSPCGSWAYVEKVVPPGCALEIYRGRRVGQVWFDGPVKSPALHRRYGDAGLASDPWMSITPMEVMTLRAGTRLAKGRVVVAGLGLGHQLVEVCARKQVSSVVLVECDAGLVEWILPRLAPHLRIPIEVVVGDAYEVLPKLEADVALVDIFPGYGGNDWGA